ncbi:uncharacterized protein DUF1552 [Roseimicrobium gellanilyticum]|uniref:Uncharacterized protein DUF1552 n=1 Tax=Roseimicrobium gellanilyticum TaxID=748857 RepID=A0A366H267_9BACT|nr:DUF1552 domain-containing protein [Roseimicrobium gellanilyticum]RBP35329.1 uncharacterized protein DUF1552 [Roseimicrobium gellanilyticum]
MNAPHIARPFSRRRFLRGAGVSLALPLLECMTPVFSRAAQSASPKRMLIISNNLGFLPKPFFPTATGFDYELTPTLSPLAEVKREFSIFSGMSHPDVNGGHSAENCFLTAARGPTKSGFRNQISLDQFAVEKLGQLTRFPSLNLGVNIDKANRSLSWTRDGVLLPAEDSATALFRRMFIQGDPETVKRQLTRLDERGSILDTLREQMGGMNRGLGSEDRARLDQYLTSVREVEERLVTSREWELKPKPVTTQQEPTDIQDKKRIFDKLELMLAMSQLAFESDSTRIVTLMVDAFATPAFNIHGDENTTEGYHGLSHHGQAPDKVKQLADADRQQMVILASLIQNLASKKEDNARLLDRTMVLFGSNMGDANKHDNTNLPVILAGGGLKHGQHHAFKHDNNTPLCNLFVTLLQQMGVATDKFSSSAGTMNALV